MRAHDVATASHGDAPESRGLPSVGVVALASGLVLATTLASGALGDHSGVYFLQWASVLTGYPYTSNDYGPMHNVFAPLFGLEPLLPKLAFAGLALMIAWILTVRGARTGVARPFGVVAALFLFNPIVVAATYVYGQNDIVAAACIALALRSRADGRLVLAGIFVGAAALEKFFPLALAAFLALDGGGRVRLRVLASAAGTFVAGMLAAIWAWGPGVLTPILWAEARTPKMLSPLRTLVEHPQLVGGASNLQFLVDTNVVFMFALTGLAFLGLLWLGTTWRIASAIGCLVLLVTYKVGHPQFYVTWLVLLSWLFVDGEGRTEFAARERAAAERLIPVAVFVATFQVLYMLGLVGMESAVRRYAGLPFLAVVIASLAASVRKLPKLASIRTRVVW